MQGLDREKLQNEYQELEEKIAYYLRVLGDENLVKSILKEELQAISDKYGDDRKTEIQDVEDEIDIEDLIEEEECVFTLTAKRVHQAHSRQRIYRPEQRAVWAKGHHHPGGGYRGGCVHRLHPRLYSVLYRHRQGV